MFYLINSADTCVPVLKTVTHVGKGAIKDRESCCLKTPVWNITGSLTIAH